MRKLQTFGVNCEKCGRDYQEHGRKGENHMVGAGRGCRAKALWKQLYWFSCLQNSLSDVGFGGFPSLCRITCRTFTGRRSTCWEPLWRSLGRGHPEPHQPVPPSPAPKPTASPRTWAVYTSRQIQVRGDLARGGRKWEETCISCVCRELSWTTGVEMVPLSNWKCSRPGWWCSEQPGTVEGLPAHGRGWNQLNFRISSRPDHSGIYKPTDVEVFKPWLLICPPGEIQGFWAAFSVCLCVFVTLYLPKPYIISQ